MIYDILFPFTKHVGLRLFLFVDFLYIFFLGDDLRTGFFLGDFLTLGYDLCTVFFLGDFLTLGLFIF